MAKWGFATRMRGRATRMQEMAAVPSCMVCAALMACAAVTEGPEAQSFTDDAAHDETKRVSGVAERGSGEAPPSTERYGQRGEATAPEHARAPEEGPPSPLVAHDEQRLSVQGAGTSMSARIDGNSLVFGAPAGLAVPTGDNEVADVKLQLTGPEGSIQRTLPFQGGATALSIFDEDGNPMPDGVYKYEASVSRAPAPRPEIVASAAVDENGRSFSARPDKTRAHGPALTGSFRIHDGEIVQPREESSHQTND